MDSTRWVAQGTLDGGTRRATELMLRLRWTYVLMLGIGLLTVLYGIAVHDTNFKMNAWIFIGACVAAAVGALLGTIYWTLEHHKSRKGQNTVPVDRSE